MDKKIEEALVCTMEECGEVIQACSKMIRTDGAEKYATNLQEEVGDVLCMIEILHTAGLLDEDKLLERMKKKKRKLKKWSNIFDEG